MGVGKWRVKAAKSLNQDKPRTCWLWESKLDSIRLLLIMYLLKRRALWPDSFFNVGKMVRDGKKPGWSLTLGFQSAFYSSYCVALQL